MGKSVAVGLDIGGTKIAGGLVEVESGHIVARQVIPTLPERGGDAVLEDSLALADQLISEAGALNHSVLGIGIGICELVDPDGNITDEYKILWKDLPVIERFSQLAPTIIESDARAPAVAEARYGAGKAYRHFSYVTVGTGISYALVQDGQPLKGARGNAILLGSSPFSTRCPHCGEVTTHVLEEFASGPAMVARYNTLAQKRFVPYLSEQRWDKSFPGDYRDEPAKLKSGQELLAVAAQGDEVANAVVKTAADALGNSVAFMINLLDPEAVVVGGGLGLAGGRYWERFVEATRQHIYANDTRNLPILPAELGVDAGLIGASVCAINAFG